MATDRARNSYDPRRQYRSVVAQQGRVTLDADANEAEQIRAEESRAELIDIIGPSGSPDRGFQISVPSGGAPFELAIGAGTIYVGGLRVHQVRSAKYDEQSRTEWMDRRSPDPDAPSANTASEIIYLELEEREVTAVEDPALREVALGGPDTTARTRLIQRVRRGAITEPDCAKGLAEVLGKRNSGLVFATKTNELLSNARLKVTPVAAPTKEAECQPIASNGFLGAENQLIRVQVSREGDLLWSYDNASALYRAKTPTTAMDALELIGHPVDEFHHPRPHQWVEVLHPAVDLGTDAFVATGVGELYEVDSYDAGTNTITLKTPVANLAAPLFVRVWQRRIPFGSAQELVDSDNTEIGVRIETQGTATPGDFWMIGVRPTHPDQIYPRRFLDGYQAPDGPHRWVTPLATVRWKDSGRIGVVHDCRKPFKPLTEDDDLAFHNQHLHGWGVVCGMQVHCMELDYAKKHRLDPKEWVTIQNGYAIDPTGVDIRLSSGTVDKLTTVPIADLAVAEGGLQRTNGAIQDGSVSLWIDQHRELHVDPYRPKQGGFDWKALWQELQAAPPGESMLADVYRDCILKVVDYIRALVPESSDPKVTFSQRLSAVLRGVEVPSPKQGLVGESARRLIALLNLVWQVYNPSSSRHIYLSGDADQPMSEWTEDGLLRAFFEDLKDLLQSKTFCAMFDDVQYPKYDVYRERQQAQPTTIFGTNRHKRIRVHHKEKLAFTCGTGSQINVYDLGKNRILRCIDFPEPGAEVQDVAFSNAGNEIYAVAWVGPQHAESMFASGVFKADGEIAWSGRRHRAQLKLVTLVNDPKSTVVYISARGSGIYRFDPCSTTDAALPTGGLVQVGPGFSASGHLVAGTVKASTAVAEVHVCVDAKTETPNTYLPQPWVSSGFTVSSLDPQHPLRVVNWADRIGIQFPAPGARFALPVPSSTVKVEVHVHASPITVTLLDSASKAIATITSTADQSKSQTLELKAPDGNGATVEVTKGSWEGVVYEVCVDGQADGGWRLFAGEDQTSPSSVAFDRVREVDAQSPGTPVFHVIPPVVGEKEHGMGHDDIAFAGDDLQAIVDGPSGTKRLLTWKHARGNPGETDLGPSAGCRIAYTKQDGGWSLVTYFDQYLGRAWRKGALDQRDFHPLQILPISIATDQEGQWFYVLEALSNTITAVPAGSARSQIDPTKLEAYRVDALGAFVKLFRRFAQFLKDCICEHLLVNCPDPTGKKVFLADVSFKNGAIYQICNFHHRRYVHTFPTVEYWMSLVPFIPFIKMQVERFCCDLKLGDIIEKHIPATDAKKAGADAAVPASALLYGMTHLKDVNLKELLSGRQAQLSKVLQYAMQKFTRPAPGVPMTPTSTAGYSGTKVNDAIARAREDGVRIANVVETTNVVDAAIKIAGGMPNVRRGEAIDLITDDGVVIGVARSAAPPGLASIIGETPERMPSTMPIAHYDEIVKLRQELRLMRGELDELKTHSPSPRPKPHE